MISYYSSCLVCSTCNMLCSSVFLCVCVNTYSHTGSQEAEIHRGNLYSNKMTLVSGDTRQKYEPCGTPRLCVRHLSLKLTIITFLNWVMSGPRIRLHVRASVQKPSWRCEDHTLFSICLSYPLHAYVLISRQYLMRILMQYLGSQGFPLTWVGVKVRGSDWVNPIPHIH